jgi:hypothetical protein
VEDFGPNVTITNFFMISDRVMNLVDLILPYARGLHCVSNYHITLQTQVTECLRLAANRKTPVPVPGLVHCITQHTKKFLPVGAALNFEHFTK